VTELQRLQRTILDLHGCHSTHLRSERVHETVDGETAWEGVVHVFALKGHPKAGLAYAWSEATEGGGRRFLAVLGVGPIKTARDAVLAVIVAHDRA
jgi:hypothetical protein